MAAAIARVTAAAPTVRSSRPDVPVEVDALVARCLERDPAARFQNAAELAAALDAAGAAGGTPLAPPLVPGGPAAPRRGSTPEPSGPVAHAPTAVEARPVATDPGGPRPEIQRAAPRRRRRWTGVLPIVLVTVVLLGAAGFLIARGVGDGNGLDGSTTTTGAPADGVRIAAAKDFDPFVGDGEHPETVDNVFDKNTDTFWTTSEYRNPTMDKPGVGIYVQLAAPTRVRTVDVDTGQAGWNGAIYAANTPGAKLDAWGQPLAQQTNLGTHAHFTLQPPTTARYVLLWLTKLPPQGGGFALHVNEVRVG